MRTVKCVKEIRSSYLSVGQSYTIESLNGGPYDQIYFTNTSRPSGTYLSEHEIKKALREKALVFID